MQETGELYRQILTDNNHRKEVRVEIAGTVYGQENLISVRTSGGLFTEPGVGNCASRQIDLEILPLGDIPRQAQIRVYVRLTLDGQETDWLNGGVFFISTRAMDKRTGSLTITGYDAMLKAENVWLNENYDTENWPMPAADAVADIAYRMGVEVDPRTDLTGVADVAYPVDENGDLTMREVLGYIAVSAAGNWILTDAGALRLIRYGDVPEETCYLVEEYGDAITFGGDRILV